MYDIIFFTDDTNNIASAPPIGAYKCAHVLRKNGYKCLVVNHFSAFTLDELYKLIDLTVDNKTKLIGFSTTFLKSIGITKIEGQPSPLYPELPVDQVFPHGKEIENQIIKYCRDKNSKIKTLVGGAKAHPNFNNKNIDYVCIGYSEVSVVNLANYLNNIEDLQFATKNIWGTIVLDDRFAKTYDFSNSDFEWLPEDVVNHKTLPIEIARGCIFKCKFCSYPLNGKQNLDFVKSEKQLDYELRRNYEEFGINTYLLVDDTFNDHEDKLNKMLRVVKQLPFQPKFWGYHRLDLISTRPHTMDILYDIGVRSMFFGIETLNPISAKIIGKGYDRKKQIKALETMRTKYDNDISLHGSFIIGLPQDTEEYAMDTYQQILNQTIPLHSWNFYPLIIFRQNLTTYASDIEKNFKSYGYEEIHELGESLIPNNSPIRFDKIINWKNQNTDFQRVTKLSNFITKNSYENAKMHVSGQFAMSIASMNHPVYNFETVRNTFFRDFNFYEVEEVVRKQFIEEYKQKLFAHLAQ
ncbi:COG1032 Fe-S oxidoreductase [uncultured Caudovirales phage]|uniref:COG1032 Fe-S oxidoreductase n=1 Tax=uncultured Caudovirales phage TaxID=2100421 RepID=A0A6J5LFT0_9CAUD|nr:COG1032 Fe-S oxidoreductase [uncultured Caudovirales phage]